MTNYENENENAYWNMLLYAWNILFKNLLLHIWPIIDLSVLGRDSFLTVYICFKEALLLTV